MTLEEAIKMLKAKLECLKNETSGINHDCNMRLCDGCSLNYEQGNMGEQKEALDMAIKALEQISWIPVSKRLPEDLEPVNITWVNHNPESYYAEIKDKPFTATGVYFNGQWYWWSTLCADILAEYSHNYDDVIDDAIEVIAWMPLPQSYRVESEEKKMNRMEKKEELLKELANENLQVLMTAYMYAKGLNMYGEDVTRKFLTATENAAMLDKAYSKGYYDGMDKLYKDTDTEHLKANIVFSLNDVICLGPSIDDEARQQLYKSLAEAIKNKIIIEKEEIVADNLNAIKYSADIFINFGKR